jgi:hypothetical protein
MKLALFASALVIAATPALAGGADYLGAWKLSAAGPAPWADAAARPLDKAEPQRLRGKTVTFKPDGITGPQPFACKGAHYKIKQYTADMVFQGAFGEMHAKDKSADPQNIAAKLGFAAGPIKTLETGCEIDFHFVDAATAKAGLNDYVYTLEKP